MLYKRMMNPRTLYVTLITSCIFILILSFTSWNKQKLFIDEYEDASNKKIDYYIDLCTVNKSTLFIKGWLFNENYPKEGNLIVTATFNEKEIIVPSLTYVRDDVAQSFSRKEAFDKVGFNASINKLFVGRSEKIVFKLYVKNNNKNSKVLTYECK